MNDPMLRRESDTLGERELPAAALYGIHSLRGAENFRLSGRLLRDETALVRAMAMVKLAAAEANRDIGALSSERAAALVQACREVLDGAHREAFIVDLLEGSGGTSLNMNVNEVLANRALQLLGSVPGDYARLHPNDHVNLGQSTNDVVPTAIKLATHALIGDTEQALRRLAAALERQAEACADVLRLGRTCLQDGQPMTLGQAFGGYASLVRRCAEQLAALRPGLLVVPLGGTAIGTGLGSSPGYRERALAGLSALLGAEVSRCGDAFDGMQNLDTLARVSGELRTTANALWKIASDLIVLSSGPDGGLGEVALPAVQAGSSIMPGKVNPVMPMTLCQIAFAITGNDACVALAAQQGQLEINHFEMVLADRLFDSLRLLGNGATAFAERCIDGLEPRRERSLENLLASSALATALVPRLGYTQVSALVKGSQREGRSFLETAEAAGLLSRAEVIEQLHRCVRGEV